MNDLLDLYLTFVKIGCVNFGGGYAMLPLLERELVDKKHWTTMDDLRDYFSIGQCTPGIIALNVSTFIRVCVCVLIVQAVMRLWKKSIVDAFTLGLYLVIFVLNAFSSVLPVKVPAAVLVICAGVIGVVMSMRHRKEADKK